MKRFRAGQIWRVVSKSALCTDERGIAAVEFALILPVMLILYVGLVEVSRMVSVSQKISRISHTVADLAAQKLTGGDNPDQAALYVTDRYELVNAAYTLLAPYPSSLNGVTKFRLTVSEVLIVKNSSGVPEARVQWSLATGGARVRSCFPYLSPTFSDDLMKINANFLAAATQQPTYVIIADVYYEYPKLIRFGLLALPAPNFYSVGYAPVRNSYDPPHIQMKFVGANLNCNPPGK